MKYKLNLNGRTYEVEVELAEPMAMQEYQTYAPAPAVVAAPVAEAAPSAAPVAAAPVAGDGLRVDAPMPGTILKVNVAPGQAVKEGDVLTVKKVPVMRFTYKVLGIVERRLPAKDVPTYCLDMTPEEEMAKLNPPKETIFVMRERGAGRPTKKERRDLDALWEQF